MIYYQVPKWEPTYRINGVDLYTREQLQSHAADMQQLQIEQLRGKPEIVSWRTHDGKMWCYFNNVTDMPQPKFQPLYTTPPQREWVGLTMDELIDLEKKHLSHEALTRAIEAKLKEKNT